MRIGEILIVIAALTIAVTGGHDSFAQESAPSAGGVTEGLDDWKHNKLVTLDCKDMPLGEVLKEIQRQSGREVQVYFFQDNAKGIASRAVTLTLDDAPFWKAVAEVSRASGTGFCIKNRKAVFTADTPLLKDYEIVGPVLIGLVERGEEIERTVEALGPRQRQFSIKNPGERKVQIRIIGLGESGQLLEPLQVVLLDEDGQQLGDPMSPEAGEMGLEEGELLFSVPDSLRARATGAMGQVKVRLLCDPIDLAIPLSKNQTIEKSGLRATIAELSRDGANTTAKFSVVWDHGFTGEDANRYKYVFGDFVARPAIWAWVRQMGDKLAAYAPMETKVVDGQGTEKQLLGTSMSSRDTISGSCTIEGKDTAGLVLHVTVGRMKFAEVRFSFQNIWK